MGGLAGIRQHGGQQDSLNDDPHAGSGTTWFIIIWACKYWALKGPELGARSCRGNLASLRFWLKSFTIKLLFSWKCEIELFLVTFWPVDAGKAKKINIRIADPFICFHFTAAVRPGSLSRATVNDCNTCAFPAQSFDFFHFKYHNKCALTREPLKLQAKAAYMWQW